MRVLLALVATVCATLAALALTAGSALAAQPRAAVGPSVRLPQGTRVLGQVHGDRRITFSVGLASRDELALSRYAQAVSDPKSGDFRHYLTTREFADRFGAPVSHLRAVAETLRRDGLSVTHTYANHLTLNVSGSASVIEHAFATRLALVRLADGRRTFANTTTPTLPQAVAADVAVVSGLQGVDVPEAMDAPAHAGLTHATEHADATNPGPAPVSGAAAACSSAVAQTSPVATSVGSYWGYTANTLAAAYGYNALYAAGDFGAGQTVALFETETIDPADVAAFQACYGTAAPVNYINVGTPAPIDAGADGDGEAALDVDEIVGLAPRATVDVYQGGTTDGNSLLSAIVSQNVAKTISLSYGFCETDLIAEGGIPDADFEYTLFAEAAIQGQTVLAATGDNGSHGCIRQDANSAASLSELSAVDFATQPFVTAVGGTNLSVGSGSTTAPWTGTGAFNEGVWNDGANDASDPSHDYGGGGGGISQLWKMPAYQSSAAATLGVVNASSSGAPCGDTAGDCREVPDLSGLADQHTGYVIYANSDDAAITQASEKGWQVSGGTSAAAPQLAAMVALADALPACRGFSLGAINPLLYALAGSNYPLYFRDTTLSDPFYGTANNDVTGMAAGAYPVTAGYDMATGLGTPNVGNLAPGMCLTFAPVLTVSLPALTTVKATVGRWFSTSVAPSDSGGRPVTLTVSGLPAGAHFLSQDNEIYGLVKKAGSYPVTVFAADNAGNSTTLTFTLKVVKQRTAAKKKSKQHGKRTRKHKAGKGEKHTRGKKHTKKHAKAKHKKAKPHHRKKHKRHHEK